MPQNPLVSIIICSYNRMQYLPKCLEHLKNQTCKTEDYEIVLINNNSTDKTELICKEYIQKNPELNVSYFLEKNPGLSHARNRGVEEAKGNILCFIDILLSNVDKLKILKAINDKKINDNKNLNFFGIINCGIRDYYSI